jgi:hypothetical protein
MRWLAFLVPAACASWQGTEWRSVDRETLPALLAALRDSGGDAKLIAGDRFYEIRGKALEPEIRALTRALADAIEATGGALPHTSSPRSRTGLVPVESFACVDRALCVGRVTVNGIRTDRAWCYRAEAAEGPDRHVFAEVVGTAAIEGAWSRLADAARAQAGATWSTFLLSPDLRTFGVDVRGYGGSSAP